jgi:hypothetical protein
VSKKFYNISADVYPTSVWVAFTPQALSLLGKRHKLPVTDKDFTHDYGGRTTVLVAEKRKACGIIVTFDKKGLTQEFDVISRIGLIAHESSHVVDELFAHIGEQSPGAEQRAYLTQYFVEEIAAAWEDDSREDNATKKKDAAAKKAKREADRAVPGGAGKKDGGNSTQVRKPGPKRSDGPNRPVTKKASVVRRGKA